MFIIKQALHDGIQRLPYFLSFSSGTISTNSPICAVFSAICCHFFSGLYLLATNAFYPSYIESIKYWFCRQVFHSVCNIQSAKSDSFLMWNASLFRPFLRLWPRIVPIPKRQVLRISLALPNFCYKVIPHLVFFLKFNNQGHALFHWTVDIFQAVDSIYSKTLYLRRN